MAVLYDGNLGAFLDMIAVSELGPALLACSDDGYDVIVGSTAAKPNLFTSYDDHPRVLVDIPTLNIKSSAAGRYQILRRIYDHYKVELGLNDFSPYSQDAIAMRLIQERKAVHDIEIGDIGSAIYKCKSAWASLPESGYGQHEHKKEYLIGAYQKAGGVLA